MVLRYTDIRDTSIKEIKEKMEQYGTVISIRNKKSEYEKIQKESMVYMFCNTIKRKNNNDRHKTQLPP